MQNCTCIKYIFNSIKMYYLDKYNPILILFFLTKEFGSYLLLSCSNLKPHHSSLNNSFQLSQETFYLTIGHQHKFLEYWHSYFSIPKMPSISDFYRRFKGKRTKNLAIKFQSYCCYK